MNKPDLAESMRGVMVFTYGAAIIWFMLFFWGGMYHFYKAKKLLQQILSLNVFDGGQYSKKYLHKSSWIFYTTECLYGTISEYPVILSIVQSFSKYTPTRIEFSVCITKFNRSATETISFPLDWKGRPKGDIRHDVLALVCKIKDKGYPKGELSNA